MKHNNFLKQTILFLSVISLLFMVACTTTKVEETTTETSVNVVKSTNEGMIGEPDVIIKIEGRNYAFFQGTVDNLDINVKKDDIVRVEFSSVEGFHDFVIDEFNAATTRVTPENGMVSVEFVANQVGTFEYYCSVGNHRELGMKGAFIVE